MIGKAPKRVILTAFVSLVILLLAGITAFAGSSTRGSLEMSLKAAGSDNGIIVRSSLVDGREYFFLPSGVHTEHMQSAPGEDASFNTMQSSEIASLHFFSKDPDAKGMDYVHQNKDNKAKGELIMCDENFRLIYQGPVDALKGRGNTTWGWTDKKSYQLKLEKKADLLDPESGGQKAKKWILLANPFDPTLIRNYMIYNFGKEIGLDCTPDGRPVDLYYDGEYRGSYYLCEKVEIGENRVETVDLEEKTEAANPGADFDALNEVTAVNSKGLQVHYTDGISDPDDISGGYLVEFDSVYYNEEKSWFNYYGPGFAAVKSPEYTSANMMEYISTLFADASDYIMDAERRSEQGDRLQDYIDLDSFARFFLINEWFANNDIWTSSTYIYKPAGDDHLYAGPVWDCDSSMRIQGEDSSYDSWFAASRGQLIGKQLLGLPVFRQKLQEIYRNDMRPVIYDILLGKSSGKYLKPAEAMKAELADSAAMNYMIWDINDCGGTYYPKATVEENYDEIMTWMRSRAQWFDEQIMSDSFVPNSVKPGKTGQVSLSLNTGRKTCRVSFGKTSVQVSNPSARRNHDASDYQIAYRKAGSSKWKTVNTGGKTSYTLKNLKAGAAYDIRVRALDKNGAETVYGKYSAVKRVFVRKVSPRLKAGKKSLNITWSKASDASRYQIKYSTDKNFKKSSLVTVKSLVTKRAVKNLKSGKTYYIRMRCFKTISGKRYYSGWSAAKKVKIR